MEIIGAIMMSFDREIIVCLLYRIEHFYRKRNELSSSLDSGLTQTTRAGPKINTSGEYYHVSADNSLLWLSHLQCLYSLTSDSTLCLHFHRLLWCSTFNCHSLKRILFWSPIKPPLELVNYLSRYCTSHWLAQLEYIHNPWTSCNSI